MTDITRLIASLKRRTAHAKDFGDDITFVKLEDIDALVEALEKAQQHNTEQDAELEREREKSRRVMSRIYELESSTVTVKLPDDEDGQAYGFGKWANGKLPATAGTMTIAYCEDAWRAAFEVFSSAAGIKWEAE